MKKEDFYRKYANTPLARRSEILSSAANSLLQGINLKRVYREIKDIDFKLLNDEIRREELLKAVEPFLK